jgi:hypothetical protein
MSKSRRYTIPGQTSGSKYVFTFNDKGEVEGVKKQSQQGRPFLSVDPNSTEFEKVTSTSQALNAYNVNNHKGRKDNYETEIKIASNEQKNNKHATEKKKEDNENKEIDETGEKINGVTTASATTTENKIPILFRYPYDIDTNQDHLKIVQYEYKRNAKREFNNSSPDKYGTVISDKNKPYGKYNGSVLLPMPKVSDSNGAEWGKSDLNVFGIAAGGLASDVLNDLNQGTGLGSNTFDSLSSKIFGNEALDSEDQDAGFFNRIRENIAKGQENLGNTATAGLAIGAQELSKLAGINLSADEFLARATGEILNPNAELLFQGPVLRDFGFKFLMIARSSEEAKMIRNIIRFFKVGAAPRFLNGPALLGTPNVFQLEYRAGDKTLNTVNRFNEMALRTITVDYAPDGFWSAYQDSHPVAIVMSLQFSELRPLYSSDHENETLEGSVGY